MELKYRGTGTVRVEGAGEVSHGGTLEVPEAAARALLEEQPQAWEVHASVKAAREPRPRGAAARES